MVKEITTLDKVIVPTIEKMKNPGLLLVSGNRERADVMTIG